MLLLVGLAVWIHLEATDVQSWPSSLSCSRWTWEWPLGSPAQEPRSCVKCQSGQGLLAKRQQCRKQYEQLAFLHGGILHRRALGFVELLCAGRTEGEIAQDSGLTNDRGEVTQAGASSRAFLCPVRVVLDAEIERILPLRVSSIPTR